MIHRQHQVWQAFGEPPVDLKLHGLLPVFTYWVHPAYSFAVKLSMRIPEAFLLQPRRGSTTLFLGSIEGLS